MDVAGEGDADASLLENLEDVTATVLVCGESWTTQGALEALRADMRCHQPQEPGPRVRRLPVKLAAPIREWLGMDAMAESA